MDDPFVYQEPPIETKNQSFILTHNGVMWEDICFDNLGGTETYDELIKKMKENVTDDEWSLVEFKATEATATPVASCPAKYDVYCDYEEKDIEFSLHFGSEDASKNDTSVKEKVGNLKYRAHFSPSSYNTSDEKNLIRASCFLQENEVQGIENRLDKDGEWK